MAAHGHCVAFAQEIDQPGQIFPRLPPEIKIIKVRKHGRNDTSKDFVVRRAKVVKALHFLKSNTPGYEEIIISEKRINMLPDEGEINIETLQYTDNVNHINDVSPVPQQNTNTENIQDTPNGVTSISGVPLQDVTVDIQQQVQNIVSDVVGNNAEVTIQ